MWLCIGVVFNVTCLHTVPCNLSVSRFLINCKSNAVPGLYWPCISIRFRDSVIHFSFHIVTDLNVFMPLLLIHHFLCVIITNTNATTFPFKTSLIFGSLGLAMCTCSVCYFAIKINNNSPKSFRVTSHVMQKSWTCHSTSEVTLKDTVNTHLWSNMNWYCSRKIAPCTYLMVQIFIWPNVSNSILGTSHGSQYAQGYKQVSLHHWIIARYRYIVFICRAL